jgi:hypothetical protein
VFGGVSVLRAAGAAVVGVVVAGAVVAEVDSVVDVTGSVVVSGTSDVVGLVGTSGEVVGVGWEVIDPTPSPPSGTVIAAGALARTASFDA